MAEIDQSELRKQYVDLIGRIDVTEEEVHQFLIRFPIFLPLYYPYSNVVFSKLALGSEHIVDFAFAREDSLGVRWHLIEIERPQLHAFTKKGDPTAKLMHAYRQLMDWKAWFLDNRSYVGQTFPFRDEMTRLGLREPQLTLVTGRRDVLDWAHRKRLNQISAYPGVHIMSFDRLADQWAIPLWKHDEPLQVCRYVGGRIETASQIKMHVTFTI